ncbi:MULTISPECIES: hypothetical protein [unclassified Nocardia]|uniref:hypothetical protein n=1 Tax=unclassified Nocardia TaxID=2637762 RepID=UPI001CE47E26|nr:MULTISPECIES: hypothetical protein [unclassified Nocardia]
MQDKDFRPLLVDLATGVWRLRDKLGADQHADDPGKLLKSITRQVNSLSDALADAGVVVQTHTGDRFDAGQSVEVVAFAPSEAVTYETVTETITPTVYIDGHLSQRGQIIVAVPENGAAQTDSEAL